MEITRKKGPKGLNSTKRRNTSVDYPSFFLSFFEKRNNFSLFKMSLWRTEGFERARPELSTHKLFPFVDIVVSLLLLLLKVSLLIC